MRKFFAFVIALALTVISTPWLHPAAADQVNVYQNNQLVKSVVFKIGVPEYVVNGQTPGVKMDVAPFIQSDRTFVPVRFLGNALGVTQDRITWDNPSQTATLQGANATLQLAIGQARVVSNGQAKAIDVAPVLKSDRTFLPARFVAEGLGYQVAWDDATQTVVCWPVGQPQPDTSAAVNYLNGQAQQPVNPPVQPQAPTSILPNGGYTVPGNTNLNILVDKDGYPKGQIDFQIQIRKGNLQQQYTDAQSILSQTIDAETVDKAISYAKQVEDALNNPHYCPITTFNSSNGMAVRVGAGGGYSIEFQVWSIN